MALFQPFRALGYVATHVPFALQARGQDHFVTTVVGNAYHVYNCKKLNLVFVGILGKDIAHVSCSGQLTLVACGNDVIARQRDVEVRRYTGHTAKVTQVLPFGSYIVTLAENNVVRIFNTETAELFCTMEDFDASGFEVTAMLHPSTYLNKILLGARDGTLQLWNIRTQRLLYTFSGWKTPVTALAQAPALDVVAVGLENGKVVVHNIREDGELMSFHHDGGPITAISFRTDTEPIMATSNTLGSVALWDLEKRRLSAMIADCHESSVASMAFLQSQPLLITSSSDNTLKIWVFDQADGSARLLRSRSGHSAPPNRVRYYGETPDILSAGHDRTLRSVCTIRDERGIELSQGALAKKARKLNMRPADLRLPPVVAMAAEPSRQKDWPNIVTCHARTSDVHTWSYEDKVMSKSVLSLPEAKTAKIFATAVALSPCGHFAVVGYENGIIAKYNIQSGILRLRFQATKDEAAHTDVVSALAVDALNSFCLSASRDKRLKIWNFSTGKLRAIIKVKSPVTHMELHRGNNLAALATADFIVRLFDVETRRVVRIFQGHGGRVTDLAWSPDARWLVTSSMDGVVRTFDVPSGRLLHWFAVPEAVTSMSFSANGEFLATTHVDNLGVFLWVNRGLYADVKIRPITAGDRPDVMALPVVGDPVQASAEAEESANEAAERMAKAAEEAGEGDEDAPYESAEQLDAKLVTLSSLPRSRWANLGRLDIIRRRNRPEAPPKAPALAPFFLSTVPGLSTTFKPMEDPLGEGDGDGPRSHIVNFGKLGALSAFQKKLCDCSEAKDYGPFMSMLKEMGLAAIDSEIRQLSPLNEGEQFCCMLDFCATWLESRRDYELVQAYLDLFLQVHGDELLHFPALLPYMERISEAHRGAWTHLDGLFQHALCLVSFFKSSVIA